jgi:hypothetical protein
MLANLTGCVRQRQVRYSSWKVIVRLGLIGALSGALCGCGNLPEPYAPPPQRPFFEAPPEATRMLNMADSDAESHFVQDIAKSLENNTWRWTGKRPTIRLFPDSNLGLSYSIDFAIADATFEQTGPVTLSFFVNDRLLGRTRYSAPGRQRMEKPIPEQWVEPRETVILAAEIDKLWVPPKPDAKPLGFILVALGLKHK